MAASTPAEPQDTAETSAGSGPGGKPASPAASGDGPLSAPMRRLATVAPLRSLHIPPLEDGGEGISITADGTDVDEATARRAHQAAQAAGFTLREI